MDNNEFRVFLKEEVRKQLEDGAFIELVVKVEKDWQKHPRSLDRFGY